MSELADELRRLVARMVEERALPSMRCAATAGEIGFVVERNLTTILSALDRLESDRRIVTDPASVCNSFEPEADAVEALAEIIARARRCHGEPPAVCRCFGACDCADEARKIIAALPRPAVDEVACCKGLAPVNECKCARPAVDEGVVERAKAILSGIVKMGGKTLIAPSLGPDGDQAHQLGANKAFEQAADLARAALDALAAAQEGRLGRVDPAPVDD